MDPTAANQVVRSFLDHIDQALNEAAGIAKAARILAENGNLQNAVKMAMGIEDPAYRAQQMLKATLLIRGELLGDILD